MPAFSPFSFAGAFNCDKMNKIEKEENPTPYAK